MEILDKKKHALEKFNCGNEALNRYLTIQAGQDMRKKLSVCFVLNDDYTGDLIGYYTLSSYSIDADAIPNSLKVNAPSNYSKLPATLLGRLAIDLKFQGKGLGEFVLMNALERALDASTKIASVALIVDPIDKAAEDFYSQYGFVKCKDCKQMILSMKTIATLLN
ncbi:MAG: hypothetical protein RLZZ155_621 [Bacteroidota bacterium]|jgi:predicted GNAT family N-acyltransferase